MSTVDNTVQKCQQALDCLPNALLVVDASMLIACINRTALTMLGYRLEEIQHVKVAKVFRYRFDSPHFNQPVELASFSQNQAYLLDCVKKDSSRFSVEVKVGLSSFLGQKAYTLSFRDATEQVAKQQQLQKEVYYSNFIVDHANEFFISCGPNLEITAVSPRTKYVVGKPQEAFLHKTLADLQNYIYGPDQEKYQQLLQKVQAKKADYTLDESLSVIQAIARFVADCGEIIPLEVAVSFSTLAPASEGEYYVGAGRKITDRLEAGETALKRSLEETEAKKMGAYKFITLMLEALQEPLKSLEAIVEKFLTFTNLSSEQKETLNNLATCTAQMRHTLTDLDQLLRPEKQPLSGHAFNEFSCETEEFSLRQVVTLALGQCAKSAKSKNLSLVTDVNSETPDKLIGDPNRLIQVLTNLLSNAIKFTQQGSVTLRVRVENIEQEKVVLRLEVVDTGIGIAKENIPKLFQPFSQLQAGQSLGKVGSGLGLSICQLIIANMGGTIGAVSEAGNGSNFYIVLPVKLKLPAA